MTYQFRGGPSGYLDFTIGDFVFRVYPDDVFADLGTLPNENTLEVNITHEQLSALADGFKRRIALAPTRVEEGGTQYTKSPLGKGYDIKLDTAKEVVFQHKAPVKTRVLGPDDSAIQWLCYRVNMTQVYNLVLQYSPGEAFLALPAVPQQDHIREGLARSVFVDAYAVFLQALRHRQELSWIYVEYCPVALDRSHVIGKYRTQKWAMTGLDTYPYCQFGDRSTSHHPLVYFWDDLKEHIKRCDYGLPIRGVRDEAFFDTIELDPRAYPGEYPELPDEFDSMDAFLGAFDPDFRDYIERRFTLNALARTQSHQQRDSYRWQLTRSLQERVQRGREYERLRVPEGVTFHGEDEGGDTEWVTSNLFDSFVGSRNPLTKGLSGNCRYILENGCPAESLTL
ncbi:hypothetical protein [Halorarum salinum]|uniref:Uncharacterized protein n=1 Tax=Halorarum salinum TaxID=2743089 RepID=A0A7D5LB76_9EURY|nr:hypothetical protein [Halobaculum salinum]QLG61935.1 hypothetical protein HUG12_09470 [Halobaculum salinum]